MQRFIKKAWKIIKRLVIVAAVVFVLDLAVIVAFAIFHPKVQKADVIVVLGAAIKTPAAYNRSLEGLRLYEAGQAPVIVVSGGEDYKGSISEAQYMQNAIAYKASILVPVILEDQSHSTFENIQNTKAKLPKAKSLIIVSDSFHLARAVFVAKRLGFEDVYWSSPSQKYYSFKDISYYYLRESMAMINYLPKFIMGK